MTVRFGAALCGGVILALSACTVASARDVKTKKDVKAKEEKGIASIYAYDGEKTANGEFANPRGLTAAHKTLPFGTKVKVTNERNGHTVTVRINDRGPFVKGRVIDLTPAGAKVLDFEKQGITKVSLAVEGKRVKFAENR